MARTRTPARLNGSEASFRPLALAALVWTPSVIRIAILGAPDLLWVKMSLAVSSSALSIRENPLPWGRLSTAPANSSWSVYWPNRASTEAEVLYTTMATRLPFWDGPKLFATSLTKFLCLMKFLRLTLPEESIINARSTGVLHGGGAREKEMQHVRLLVAIEKHVKRPHGLLGENPIQLWIAFVELRLQV